MASKVPYRWIIAVVLFAAYSVQYLDRVKTNILSPYIAADIGLTTSDIGTGSLLMLLFYGPAQLVSGWLTDRMGAKRILIFSVVAWSVMTAWMGIIHSRDEYLVRMAVFGLLIGTEYVPSARILVRWFNKEGRARAQALLSWAWIVTPAWGSVFATALADWAGTWRTVFFLTAAMGVVPLALILLLVYDRPEQRRRTTPDELEYAYRDEIAAGLLTAGQYDGAQAAILRARPVTFADFIRTPSYLAVIVVNITLVMTLYAVLNWIPFYLSDVHHFKLQEMGWWSSLYFVAGALGSYLSSYLSDRVFAGNRRVTIVASFAALAPFIFMLATIREANPGLLAVALFGMGFFANMGWGPLTALPAEIFSPEVYGKAMGFVNCFSFVVTAFTAKIFATLVVAGPAGKDYSRGWVFVGFCVIGGLIAASLIRPQRGADAPATGGAAAGRRTGLPSH